MKVRIFKVDWVNLEKSVEEFKNWTYKADEDYITTENAYDGIWTWHRPKEVISKVEMYHTGYIAYYTDHHTEGWEPIYSRTTLRDYIRTARSKSDADIDANFDLNHELNTPDELMEDQPKDKGDEEFNLEERTGMAIDKTFEDEVEEKILNDKSLTSKEKVYVIKCIEKEKDTRAYPYYITSTTYPSLGDQNATLYNTKNMPESIPTLIQTQ